MLNKLLQKSSEFLNSHPKDANNEAHDLIKDMALEILKFKSKSESFESFQRIAGLGGYTWVVDQNEWVSNGILDNIFGITAEYERSFEGWLQIVHPDWRSVMTEYIQEEVLTKRNLFDKEYQIVNQTTKETKWVHGLGQIEFNDQFKSGILIGVIFDITNKKNAELALEDSEYMLSHSQMIARIGSFVWNLIERKWTGTPTFWDIIGLDNHNESVNIRWNEILDTDLREPIGRYFQNEVLEMGNKFDYEFTVFNAKHNKRIWVHAVGEVVKDENGIAQKLIGTIQDVTERNENDRLLKESEERLSRFFKITQEGLLFHENGYAIDANRALRDIFGLTDDVRITGHNILNYIHKDYHNLIKSKMRTLNPGPYEVEGIRSDGTPITLEIIPIIYTDDSQSVRVASVRDITERKILEQTLRESEMKYRYMFVNNPQPMFIVQKDTFNFLEVNDAAIEHYGYSKTEFLSMTELAIVHPEDLGLINLCRNTLNQDFVAPIEVRHFKKNGEINYVIISMHQIQYEEQVAIHIMVNDITSSKEAENALKRSESELLNIIDRAPVAMVLVGADRKISFANGFFRRIFNTTDDIILGQLPGNALGCINIVNKDVSCGCGISCTECKLRNSLESTFDTSSSHTDIDFDYAISFGDVVQNKSFIISTAAIHFQESKSVLVCLLDISDRKQMENMLVEMNERYQLVSENISDGIFTCVRGKIDFVNGAMQKIFDRTEQELHGLMLTQLVDGKFHEKLNEILLTKSSTNSKLIVEVEYPKSNGNLLTLDIIIRYVSHENKVYGVVRDVTEKKNIHKRNMVKAIIQTEERERDIFARELHDGLGPLLSIDKLYMQSLSRAKTDALREDLIHKATDVLEQAIVTVKEISNKLSPHVLSNYGIGSALKNYVSKINSGSFGVVVDFESNITTRFEPEIEICVYRVATECINNSLKYSKATNIKLCLHQNLCELSVDFSDNGVGFELEQLMADERGLGLYNIQNRIQSINGLVNMNSAPGEGVNYKFIIPFSPIEIQ